MGTDIGQPPLTKSESFECGMHRRRALLEWIEPLIDRIVELVDARDRLMELR